MIMSLKQREIKFKPRTKLNHNIYIYIYDLTTFIQIRRILPLVSSIPSSDGATRDSAIPLSVVSVVELCVSISLV